MKRFVIYWKIKNEVGEDIFKNVEIIASTFKKALEYCVDKIKDFNIDTVNSVYSYNDVLIAN